MGIVQFYKYQATGNDFVLFDNRNGQCNPSPNWVIRICDRRQGIGADGLILLEQHPGVDFKMVYYNKDGTQSLCGNGCRAAVSLAARLNIVDRSARFMASDGAHSAEIIQQNQVRLTMKDVCQIKKIDNDLLIDTGSPHYIRFIDGLNKYDVRGEGRKIRYSKAFSPQGVNANFVERLQKNEISLRTYERGVEDETLSCGTGAVAAAMAAALCGYCSPLTIRVRSGDTLTVEFKMHSDQTFSDVFLSGSVTNVFDGSLPC